jgi:cytochrome P450
MTEVDTEQAGLPITPPTSEIDWWALLSDPDFLAAPYAQLKDIRELAPVHYDPASGIYFVLGHREFCHMLTAPEMGRDTRLWTNGWNRTDNKHRDPLSYELFSEFHAQMTNMDPPDHRRMRDVYEKAFRQTDLKMYRLMIEEECQKLLDTLSMDTPIDFMAAVATPLARSVTRKVFEVSPEIDEHVAEWVEALSLIGNIMMSPDQKRDAQSALRAFKAYLRERFASEIDEPEKGFVGLTLAALADGIMDEEECLNNLVTLISGGAATATLLGNGMLTLLKHPVQIEKLRANRDFLRSAIEEILRYEPGGSFILRVAIQDFQCGDVGIPAGALALGLVAATNRDPEFFADPDTFDIARQPNPHLVFGAGPHICIGKTLVRMTAEIAFSALLDRFERIELSGQPVWWTHRSDQHGLDSLPLRLGNT